MSDGEIDRPDAEMAFELERRRIIEAPAVWARLPGDVGLVELTHLGGDASTALTAAIERHLAARQAIVNFVHGG